MRFMILGLALLGAGSAIAQVSPATPDRTPPAGAATTSTTPGTTTPSVGGVTSAVPETRAGAPTAPAVTAERPANAGPVPGANSFTEGQARGRIEGAGFSNVADLQKDDQGIWRGKAQRSGQPVEVALDFQGNVSSR